MNTTPLIHYDHRRRDAACNVSTAMAPTTEKFQNKYRIKSARAPWHDYNGGFYFITICTKNREHFFGKIETGIMQLSKIGKYAFENLQNITLHNPYAEIPLFVVMPNHIHAIVFVDGNYHIRVRRDVACNVPTNTMATTNKIRNKKMIEIAKHQSLLCVTMRGFKSAVTKFAHDNNIDFAWQTRFYDSIICNQNEMNRVVNYIESNPVRWNTDCFNK